MRTPLKFASAIALLTAQFQGMDRVLRSGASFSSWDGTVYRVKDPNFNFPALVQRSVEEEREEWTDDEDNDYDLIEGEDSDAEDVSSSAPPPPPPPIPPSAHRSGQKHHANKRSKAVRQRKRKLAQEALDAIDADPEVRQATRRKHVGAAEPIARPAALEHLPVTKTGYTAKREPQRGRAQHRTYRLEDMVGPDSMYKFDLVRWEGRKTVPYVTPGDERVFMILAGRPAPPEGGATEANSYDADLDDLADLIEETAPQLSLTTHQRRHRRGVFPATAHGHAYGGGRKEPMNIVEKPANVPLFRKLLQHRGMKRIAGYSTGVATGWAPKLVRFYRQYGKAVRSRYPHLKRNFRHGVWAALTINYGPRTITLPHRDFANVPWGWCPITALGRYDPRRGGHLIIWELKLVIEFPPGATIIIPSSVLTHSNVAVGRNERRYSVTQYTAGGLMRWVDQGFRTKEAFVATLSPQERQQQETRAAGRYREGLAMFSTLSELRSLAARSGTADEASELSDLTDLEDSSSVVKQNTYGYGHCRISQFDKANREHILAWQYNLNAVRDRLYYEHREFMQALPPAQRWFIAICRRVPASCLSPGLPPPLAQISPMSSAPLEPPPSQRPTTSSPTPGAATPPSRSHPGQPHEKSATSSTTPPAHPPPANASRPPLPRRQPQPSPPPPGSRRKRKRKSRAKPKKERNSRKNWAEGVRKEILQKYVPLYVDALAQSWEAAQAVIHAACAEYHALFPWWLSDDDDPDEPLPDYDPKNPPVMPPLSAEEEKTRSAILTQRNAAIHRWIHWRAKKLPGYRHRYRASPNNPYDRLMVELTGLSAKGAKKALQPIQQYSVEHPELVAAANSAFEEEKARGGGSVIIDKKSYTKRPINYLMKELKKTFDPLPADEKKAYGERARAFAKAEKERWDNAFKSAPKRDPKSILHFTIGKNKMHLPFALFDEPRFQKDVLGFFGEYLDTVWSDDECAAAAMPPDDEPTEPVAAADEHSGPLGCTRFTEEEVSDSSSDDDSDDSSGSSTDDDDHNDQRDTPRPRRKRMRRTAAAGSSSNKHVLAPPSMTSATFDPQRAYRTFADDNAPPTEQGHARYAWELEKFTRTIRAMSWQGESQRRQYEQLLLEWKDRHYVDVSSGVFYGLLDAPQSSARNASGSGGSSVGDHAEARPGLSTSQPFDMERSQQTFTDDNPPPIELGAARFAWELEKFDRSIVRLSWKGPQEKQRYEQLMQSWRATHYVDTATGLYVAQATPIAPHHSPSDSPLPRTALPLAPRPASPSMAQTSSHRATPVPPEQQSQPSPVQSTPPRPAVFSPAQAPPRLATPSPHDSQAQLSRAQSLTLSRPASPSSAHSASRPTASTLSTPPPRPSTSPMASPLLPKPASSLAVPASALNKPQAAWFVDAWRYIAQDFGTAWGTLLSRYAQWEEVNGYTNARKPLPMLNRRPKEVATWIANARWTRGNSGEPNPKDRSFARRILRGWWAWYRCLMPSWRQATQEGDVLEPLQDNVAQFDMGKLETTGINGVYNLIVLLKWVKEGVDSPVAGSDSIIHPELDQEWQLAVRDLSGMLDRMYVKKKAQY
ncbi:uncharacterized protein SCHCODRAFT_01030056 [Schizophyllum commune H4-8]|uniref:Uncharacterized protein n=1 Tax=Schizophyllum commune (strain H4-8 / FGSC 9210) TaxID=578458 RepID=D8PUW1_SCHCM|nr:uncharacterized protein SCHCODRAFT_01030056 [Schizophyllum commune H4-8]KAI5900598.1 hypothetical protein SCHCODRAFT_01030056 [Schizophyllum commune H4-8]